MGHVYQADPSIAAIPGKDRFGDNAPSWSIFTTGHIGYECAVNQSRTRSFDRKKSMLLLMKTMLSHHFAAGTRQWKSQSDGSGP